MSRSGWLKAALVGGGLLFVTVGVGHAQAPEPPPLKLAIHLHSTVSTGTLPPEQIVALGHQAGLDGLVFTDSFLRHWEYGLWPFRSWLKWVIDQPSVSTFGIRRYLDTLQQLSQPATGPLVIPAVEIAPF